MLTSSLPSGGPSFFFQQEGNSEEGEEDEEANDADCGEANEADKLVSRPSFLRMVSTRCNQRSGEKDVVPEFLLVLFFVDGGEIRSSVGCVSCDCVSCWFGVGMRSGEWSDV